MRILFKVTSILLIQILVLGNTALAGGFCAQDRTEPDYLSPRLLIDSIQLTDSFLKAKILAALAKHKGSVPEASKIERIALREIFRLTDTQERAEIKEEADVEEEKVAIQHLEKSGGNVTAASQSSGFGREKVYRLVSSEKLKSIRAESDEKQKQELVRVIKRHCFDDNWEEIAAADLGLSRGGFRTRREKHGVKVRDIQREVEMETLEETKGNIAEAARRLGITRDRLKRHHEEAVKKIKKQAEQRKAEHIFHVWKETRGNRALMCKKLYISETTLSAWFKKYFIPETIKGKIWGILKEYKWNVSEASKDLRMQRLTDRSNIYKFIPRNLIKKKREQYKQEQSLKEEQKIIGTINKFIQYNNCLDRVANSLKMPRKTLDYKMRGYGISFTAIKFDRKRVIPVLRKAKGSLRLSSRELGIDRGILRKRFSKDIDRIKREFAEREKIEKIVAIDDALRATEGHIKRAAEEYLNIGERTFYDWRKTYNYSELTDYELVEYYFKNRLFIIDDCLFDIWQKAVSLDREDKAAVRFFHTASYFVLLRAQKMMGKIDSWTRNNYSSLDFNGKIAVCRRTIRRLNNLLVCNNKDIDSEVLDVPIDRIIETLYVYEQEMNNLVDEDILEEEEYEIDLMPITEKRKFVVDENTQVVEWAI